MDKPQTEGSLVKRSSRWKLILAALIAAFILTVIVALNVGYAPISFSQILLILGKQIPFAPISSASISPKNSAIILQLRLPRVLAGALVGAGLAAAGVIYQGIFRNPMADSYLLGASAGASVGYTIAVLYVTSSLSFIGLGMTQVFAFIFALLTVFVVLTISRVGGKIPTTTLLLSGIVANIFLLAIETVMQLRSGKVLSGIVAWLAGGFSDTVWTQFYAVMPIILIGIVLTFFFTRDLNVLSMGEDTAQHLGRKHRKNPPSLACHCILDNCGVRRNKRSNRFCRLNNSSHDATCNWTRPPHPIACLRNRRSHFPGNLRFRSAGCHGCV